MDLSSPPDLAEVEVWAARRGFTVTPGDDGFLVADGLHSLFSTDDARPGPDGRWLVRVRSFSPDLPGELATHLGGTATAPEWIGPRSKPPPTITLTWFIAPSRWAPATLLPLLGAYCPEALPLDYAGFGETGKGRWEGQDATGTWDRAGYAEVYEFGPEAAAEVGAASVTMPAHDVGRLWLNLPLASEDRARALFEAAGPKLGAFFAAAQRSEHHEHFLQGTIWQGLPPMPMWLGWFGPPYLELVEPHIEGERLPEGLLVREAADWTLPAELTYTARPPERHPHGGVLRMPARSGDEASVIPPIG